MKRLDITKSVFEITEEYPEIIDIMLGLGFSEISKKPMRMSVGRVMTLEKGSKLKNIDMDKIISALEDAGFEIEGSASSGPKETSKLERKASIKSYLERLNNGEDLESVRADFKEEYSSVDPKEIMDAEQQLMFEGTPLSEIQQLCDVHSALFHGITSSENKANVAKQVHDAIDMESSNLCEELSKVKGHPIYTFTQENKAMSKLIEEIRSEANSDEMRAELLDKARKIAIHYAKKGDLLYPVLNVNYDISGPSKVMWTVDDEIRDEMSALAKCGDKQDNSWLERFDAVITRSEEMIYKETNILLPICAQQFSEDDWMGIYRDSKDYSLCLGVENEIWEACEQTKASTTKMIDDQEIVIGGGSFNLSELETMLNTMPIEITLVDKNDINKYFNEGHKVFKRPEMAIGRDVFSCHPPKIEDVVRGIITSFKDGSCDSVPIWMKKEGRPFLVHYFALRDKDGNYVGTMELVQDMTFAKEYFMSLEEEKDK